VRRVVPVLFLVIILGAAAAALLPPRGLAQATRATCSAGYVGAVIGGEHKCLRAGQFCSAHHAAEYKAYGFSCVGGHLRRRAPTRSTIPATTTAGSTTTPAPPALGRTVKLLARTRTAGCRQGTLPDRRCSPGAYSSGLTKAVICSPSFRTSAIRNVPQSEKYAVEREYGMAEKPYGRTLEIDHIVSLELGGSNDISNLFPERAPGYHGKDRLENRLHSMVCSGAVTLAAAQSRLAADWPALYADVFGVQP